ncbi:PIR protein,putative [Plasmodium sp. gorilla clade G3]|nr:PIR protein,putative [Plasmodium sp. gorilla clade G3]
MILGPINFRLLVELSHQCIKNNKYENNELKEYGNISERKHEKDKYRGDDAKTKHKMQQLTKKKYTGTQNLMKYKNETYDKEKGEKSNRTYCSLKYLEMQTKLYNNIDEKPEFYIQNFSDESDNEYISGTQKRWNTFYLCFTAIFALGLDFLAIITPIKNKIREGQ